MSEKTSQKGLTNADALDRLCADLRRMAAELKYGSLSFDALLEVHDGVIRQVEHSEIRPRRKLRID